MECGSGSEGANSIEQRAAESEEDRIGRRCPAGTIFATSHSNSSILSVIDARNGSCECLPADSSLCRGECLRGLWFDVQDKDLRLSVPNLLLHLDDDSFNLPRRQMSLEL